MKRPFRYSVNIVILDISGILLESIFSGVYFAFDRTPLSLRIMTRFARARGSKSSNEKLPEEPTPWSRMKEKPQRRTEDESRTVVAEDDNGAGKRDSYSNVEKFDGFSVLREDAVKLRVEKLKLIKQGVPRHQLKARLMPMRRRAEKKLSRMRQKSCFHCRRPGHMLNQCPELGTNTALGVCFK